MGLKITIDPGHYKGYNKGINGTYFEGTSMFNLANYLKDELEKYQDVSVFLTKQSIEENPSLAKRGQIAVNNNSDVFMSLHSDAYSKSIACGVSVFRSLKLPNSKELCDRLGNAVAGMMKQDTGVTYFRGTSTKASASSSSTDYYGVIRNSVTGGNIKYSILIEHGFHSNTKECAWLSNDNNLKRLAFLEATVIAEYFNLKLKNGESDKSITSNNDVEKYEIVVDNIPGYSNASDAKNGTNPKATLTKGTYYIFRKYTNGCYNITKDSTGKTPGSWINPKDNVKKEEPEIDPDEEYKKIDISKLTPITMSANNMPVYTFEQAVSFIKSKNPNPKLNCTVEELVYSFMRAGFAENIRWDIALAQSIKETGFFKYGGQVKPEQNNFAGIGSTNNGAEGASFKTPYIGALAQIQHLKAYCNTDECTQDIVDPRFKYVTRGWAPYIEWLGMKENPKNSIYNKSLGWAVPGYEYGASIWKIVNDIKNTK